MCGPLLNYQGMTEEGTETVWHGSVLLVVEPGMQVPQLRLRKRGPAAPTDAPDTKGFFSRAEKSTSVEGLKLYADPIKTFWRFTLRIPLGAVETRWEYAIPNMYFNSEVSSSPSRDFVVPAVNQSMRLMFHSCNGFSVGTDLDYWSGEANPLCWVLNDGNTDARSRTGALEQCPRVTCEAALSLYDWWRGSNLQ
jgi:hypothetical protein